MAQTQAGHCRLTTARPEVVTVKPLVHLMLCGGLNGISCTAKPHIMACHNLGDASVISLNHNSRRDSFGVSLLSRGPLSNSCNYLSSFVQGSAGLISAKFSCKRCGKTDMFSGQAFAALPRKDTSDHGRIYFYVFVPRSTCSTKTCGLSIKARWDKTRVPSNISYMNALGATSSYGNSRLKIPRVKCFECFDGCVYPLFAFRVAYCSDSDRYYPYPCLVETA